MATIGTHQLRSEAWTSIILIGIGIDRYFETFQIWYVAAK